MMNWKELFAIIGKNKRYHIITLLVALGIGGAHLANKAGITGVKPIFVLSL